MSTHGGGSRSPWGEGGIPRDVRMPKLTNLRLPRVTGGAWLVLLVALGLWLASGIYTVAPDEAGVVRRFGRYVATTGPGLHYRLPYPVETVVTPKVTKVNREEIGFRTTDPGPPPRYRDVPEESLMLTGDENIVDAELIIQWRVKNARDFVFNVRDVRSVVRHATEAALRQVVGTHNVDDVLTERKFEIQQDIHTVLQGILDLYRSGIHIVAAQLQDVQPPEPVRAAFKDVASAREDRARLINEAQGYYNDLVPRARGEAERQLREAEAYRAERVTRARGDAERFLAMLAEYRGGKDVTRTRLYLEVMEEVLPGMTIFVMDSGTGDGVLKFLPLTEFIRQQGGGGR